MHELDSNVWLANTIRVLLKPFVVKVVVSEPFAQMVTLKLLKLFNWLHFTYYHPESHIVLVRLNTFCRTLVMFIRSSLEWTVLEELAL